jgi:hypothetical protein
MSKSCHKFEKNESYQTFTNICKPNLAYFGRILQILAQNDFQKNLFYKIILIKSNKNVKCASYNSNYKYL